MKAAFRDLPSVDQVISHEAVRQLQSDYPRALLVDTARHRLDRARRAIASGEKCPSLDDIVLAVNDEVRRLEEPALRPVINASGVLLHTNLGRAPLSNEAARAMLPVATGYSNLEFDLDTGRRGSRHVRVEELLCRLSGAEAALVVNNNASAVLLGLSALARRKEVIVSRGQAVEIGGSFRIPDVMRQSGARLVEVGTTNRTYASDYEEAVTPRTGALMCVHSSNFRLVGFVHETSLEEMVEVGSRHELPVLDDLGSGCFVDTTAFGLEPEPMVQRSVSAGAGLTFFSGDKLVGGPQAGIIVGRRDLVDRLKKHPLARAVRTDKVRLAALAATLLHYLKGEAAEKVPVWRMLAAPLEELDRRAGEWVQALEGHGEIIDGQTMIGGGSLPGATLPTRLVALSPAARRRRATTASSLGALLRHRDVPVVGRIEKDSLLLDPRSVLPEDDARVVEALHDLASVLSGDA